MAYCPECGSEIDDSNYCSECGEQINEGTDISETLNWTWGTYTDNVAGTVVPFAVTVAIYALVSVGITKGFEIMFPHHRYSPFFTLAIFVALLLVFLFVGSVFYTIPLAIASRISYNEYRSKHEHTSFTTKQTIKQIPALVASGIMITILVGIGTLLFIIPGIYLMVGLSLTISSIVVRDSGPVEAMEDSWETASGNMWHIFGVIVFIWIIIAVVSQIPFIGFYTSFIFVTPTLPIALTYIYLNNDEDENTVQDTLPSETPEQHQEDTHRESTEETTEISHDVVSAEPSEDDLISSDEPSEDTLSSSSESSKDASSTEPSSENEEENEPSYMSLKHDHPDEDEDEDDIPEASEETDEEKR